MSKSLAIIVTGQLRTFFKNDSFEKMILLSKANFTNLVIFAVLNSTDETEFVSLETFFNKLPITYYRIIDFTEYKSELESKIQDKIRNPDFYQNKKDYFSIPRDAHRGLSNPENYLQNHLGPQFFQLKIGIENLEKYIIENNITFDTVCKTRFDSKYPDQFYPHLPDTKNDIERISFDSYNQNIIENSMKIYGIKSKEDLLQFNLTHRLILPQCHISMKHSGMTMGGRICYNYESLQYLFNDETEYQNILYAFNDIYYFANQTTFLKLKHLFDESYLKKGNNPDLKNHFFCPETQFILFCLNHHIHVIMYPECFYNDGMIHR
jgi:hypothetical protein